MKNKQIVWKICTYSLIAVLGIMTILTACAEPEPEPTPTTPAPTTPAPTTPAPTTPAPTTPEPTTPAPTTPEPTTPAPEPVKWAEEMWGEPKYGGTLTIASNRLGDSWDPYFPWTANFWPFEHLFIADLAMDRDEWSYKVGGAAPEYNGLLAESWEWEDPQTLVVHLRPEAKWQNKPPTNGREFTADDVVYHYDRVLGTGEFTEPNPLTRGFIAPIIGVSARDKHTVAISFKDPSPLLNWWAATDPGPANIIEPREFVESDVTDWQNVTGTGAFIVTDYIAGNSVTMSANPDYYRYDDRYPADRLPYLDTLKVMGIIDPSTQLAAIRSGQVDMVFGLEWQTAQNLQKTNPEIVLTTRPFNGFELDTRCDKEPFTDIRVRKALQLAVDTQTIAKTHYGGLVSGNPAGIFTADYGGWAFNYEDWPEDLRQEYTYNPDLAKQLLAEAGYPDGFETNALIPNEQDMDLMQIIKAYFADIDIELEIKPVDQNQMVALAAAGQVEQMQYTENINMTWPVHIGLFNLTSMGSKYNTIAPPEGIEVYDEFYHQFANAPDEATAQGFARQAQEYALRQHWTVHITGRVYYDAAQPRLKGFAGEDVTSWNRVWFWNGFWVDDSQ